MTNFPFAGKIQHGRRTIDKSEAGDLGIDPAEAPYTAHNFVGMDGRVTVTELLTYLEEHAPGVPLDNIGIDWFSLVWVDEVTAKERADYDRRAARRTQNRIDWERKTLAELLEKYPDAQQSAAPAPEKSSLRVATSAISRHHADTRVSPDRRS